LSTYLSSLDTLESKGCKYSAEGGVLNVSKGTRILLEGLRHGTLYVLQGSTVKGPAASSSSPNDISAAHWPLGEKSTHVISQFKVQESLELNRWSVRMMPFRALPFGVPLTVFSMGVGDFGPRWSLLDLMAQKFTFTQLVVC